MASKDPPLDEIAWRAPFVADWLGQGIHRIHDNNVLNYFAHSPFYDGTSNNALVTIQGQGPGRDHTTNTRVAFENELRKRTGLEFMVATSQMDYGLPDATQSQARWVIRKQERKKRPGAEDEITVLATYFVIGETIYMAPSIGKILWAKLLSATENFNAFLSTSSTLPLYTLVLGHHYVDPAMKPKESAPTASTLPSRAASPGPASIAQEDIVMADAQDHLDGTKASDSTATTATAGAWSLFESFQLFARYGNEHMDENPLVGEPGSFSFTAARPAGVKARPPAAGSVKATSDGRQSATPLPRLASPASAPIKVEDKADKNEDKAVPAAKPKRRKSKAPKSPMSPSGPPSGTASPMPA